MNDIQREQSKLMRSYSEFCLSLVNSKIEIQEVE